jgi:NitT/TauT family transport system substrate-binding protein
MRRRNFLHALPLLAVAGLDLAGCGESGPLRIGTHPWPGYESLYLARYFGWLPETTQLIDGSDLAASFRGLSSGQLDGACMTLDELLLARDGGLPVTAVLVLDESVGADVVLARPPVRKLEDLRGKRIGMERGAVGSLILLKLLDAAGLAADDVEPVDLPVAKQVFAWRDGSIDALITYAPISNLIERDGGIRLFDSRSFPGTIFDVLAIRQDRLNALGSQIEASISAHFRAIEHMRINREDALRRIAAWRRLSYEETVADFGGLYLPELTANRRMLAPGGDIALAARSLAALMQDGHLMNAGDTTGNLIDSRFLPRSPL